MSGELNLKMLETKSLGQPNSLESVLSTVNDMGFKIYFIGVGNFVRGHKAFWKDFDESVLGELGIAYESGELSFHAIEKNYEVPLEFTVEMTWESQMIDHSITGQISLTEFETALFRRKDYGAERNSQKILEVARNLYNITHPTFGWVEMCKASGYTSLEDIAKLDIVHIYWANFFGPPFIRRFGKEYFQNAPGWKVEFLDDGGCLFVISPSLASTQKLFNEELKRYFNAKAVRKIVKKKMEQK